MYEDRKPFLKPILGGIIGSLPGMLLSVLAGYYGYKMAILGILLSIGTVFGYEKMGGSIDKQKDCIRCLVIVVIAIYLAEHLSWSMQLYTALTQNGFEVTRFLCVQHLFSFLSILELTGEYIKSVLMCYLFSLLGAVGLICGAALKDHEKE